MANRCSTRNSPTRSPSFANGRLVRKRPYKTYFSRKADETSSRAAPDYARGLENQRCFVVGWNVSPGRDSNEPHAPHCRTNRRLRQGKRSRFDVLLGEVHALLHPHQVPAGEQLSHFSKRRSNYAAQPARF